MNKKILKDYSTDYSGLKGIYFFKIITEIIKLIKKYNHYTVLDFGCGNKKLSQRIDKKYLVINYDINPNYTEVISIYDYKYDVVVINHVLMYSNLDEINNIFKSFYNKNKKLKFIIGIGRQNFLSKILMLITFNKKAHDGTKSTYKQQIKFILDNLNIIQKKNIFGLTTLIYACFKDQKKY